MELDGGAGTFTFSKKIWHLGKDLKPGSHRYQVGMITTTPQQTAEDSWNILFQHVQSNWQYTTEHCVYEA
jgi:hypothetical protein